MLSPVWRGELCGSGRVHAVYIQTTGVLTGVVQESRTDDGTPGGHTAVESLNVNFQSQRVKVMFFKLLNVVKFHHPLTLTIRIMPPLVLTML